MAAVAFVFPACSSYYLKDNRPATITAAAVEAQKITSRGYVRRSVPDFFTFPELVKLSDDPDPGGALGAKLERFWRTPVVDNSAYYSGARPFVQQSETLGPILRVATWNIEKSLHITRVADALKSEKAFIEMIDPELAPPGSERRRQMLRQRSRVATADVILLQEMDIGVNRSGYRDAAAYLAEALGMNYAYGAQALEIDPVILGREMILKPAREGRADVMDMASMIFFKADPNRYKGVFGSAVLSRYPIKNVEVFQLKTKAYDWYHEEKKKQSFLEGRRRFGADLAFHNVITREMKVGGRNFFRVDLEVPGVPDNTVSVVNVHLEIKCEPAQRQAQVEEILSYIEDIEHPVVMAGDFNSAPSDLSPTSGPRIVRRYVSKPSNLLGVGARLMGGPLALVDRARSSLNYVKNFHSPRAFHLPVLAPNKVRRLFDCVENFRFSDGSAFDFRGDRRRSINGSGAVLANSNHKGPKGQVTSFSVKRPIPPFGFFRLDWMFVKGIGGDSYRLAPHYGETLVEMNRDVIVPFSDHRASVVDLPLTEPRGL